MRFLEKMSLWCFYMRALPSLERGRFRGQALRFTFSSSPPTAMAGRREGPSPSWRCGISRTRSLPNRTRCPSARTLSIARRIRFMHIGVASIQEFRSCFEGAAVLKPDCPILRVIYTTEDGILSTRSKVWCKKACVAFYFHALRTRWQLSMRSHYTSARPQNQS